MAINYPQSTAEALRDVHGAMGTINCGGGLGSGLAGLDLGCSYTTVKIERPTGPQPVEDWNTGPLIVLSGEFRTPGRWRVPPGIKPTLANVLLHCGGVTDKADLTRVRLKRLAVDYFGPLDEFNMAGVLKGEAVKEDPVLGRGDVVKIPAASP
jgi:hypothetical protein